MGNARAKTLQEIFYTRTEGDSSADLYIHYKRERGKPYHSLSYGEFGTRVKAIASSLAHLGVQKGDRVLLSSESSPEWMVTDFACIVLGAISVPIFPTLTAKQVEYILNNCGAKAAVVSNEYQLRKITSSLDALTALQLVIVMDESVPLPDDFKISYYRFSELEREGLPDAISPAAVSEEDLVTIIYTSGTTGDPKGVMLTHRNLVSNLYAAIDAIPAVGSKDCFLSFLPLCHAFERIASYLVFAAGVQVAYAESIESIGDNMQEIRPTVMTAVPRFFERLHSRIQSSRQKMPFYRRAIFDWGLRIGKEYAKKVERKPVSAITSALFPIANKLVLSKIRERTGGRMRFFISGGAALDAELGRTFAAFGLYVLEGYGLTETSPVVAVNQMDSLTWGTVGKPLPGVEVVIAGDGEILIRGASVMKGYYNDHQATAEMIDVEGWLHSGDIGIITDDGLLKITDRKKHIIVLANGKNIAPMRVEGLLERSSLIEQAVVIGEKQDYCTALIVPSDLQATEAEIQATINLVNRELAAFEKIRRFSLVKEPFTVENGMMTPTLKIKRKQVQQQYSALIDSMYSDGLGTG